jgi:hypothetical protein
MQDGSNVFVLNLGPMLPVQPAPQQPAPLAATSSASVPDNAMPISSLPVPPLPKEPSADLDLLAYYDVHSLVHAAKLYRKGNKPPRAELSRKLGDLPGADLQTLVTEQGVPIDGASMPEHGKLRCLDANNRPKVLEPPVHFEVVRPLYDPATDAKQCIQAHHGACSNLSLTFRNFCLSFV